MQRGAPRSRRRPTKPRSPSTPRQPPGAEARCSSVGASWGSSCAKSDASDAAPPGPMEPKARHATNGYPEPRGAIRDRCYPAVAGGPACLASSISHAEKAHMMPTERPVPDRDGPRDECGVFGVYAPGHDVARLAYFGLYALQHRGQESAGIATCEGGHITTLRETGLVSQVFDEEKLRALEGDMAIGHVRYSTTGGGSWENSQPVWRGDGRPGGPAHNGHPPHPGEPYNEPRQPGP